MSKKRKPHVRTRFLIGVAAAMAALAFACFLILAALGAFRYWIRAPQDCPSPCKGDLGLNRAPGDGYRTYIPNCQPAEFELELHATRTKKGTRYPLWYRSTLRNTSCFALLEVNADGLIDGPTFRVWDENGLELSRTARKFNEIIPYSYDRTAFESMKRDPGLEWSVSENYFIGDQHYIRMIPGRSVTSLPSEILPSANWLQPHNAHQDLSINNASMAKFIEPRLRGKSTPQPPPGFAVVDGYTFQKAGKYRIQAEFSGRFRQAMLYPRYEWYQKHVPRILQITLNRSSEILLQRALPPYPDPETIYRLNVRSNTVEFEVVP